MHADALHSSAGSLLASMLLGVLLREAGWPIQWNVFPFLAAVRSRRQSLQLLSAILTLEAHCKLAGT